jgi:hypothetical protein
LSSRTDIRFAKPQALLALSIVICAWRLAKVKRFSRSEILKEYSAHRQQRRGGDETLESKASAEEGAWSRLKGSPIHADWKPKEKKGEAFQKLTRYIIEKTHIYIEANPLTKVLGLRMTKSFYTKKRNEKLQQEAESTPPQHFAPWQRKAWQNQPQQLKEARNQPSLESRKLA